MTLRVRITEVSILDWDVELCPPYTMRRFLHLLRHHKLVHEGLYYGYWDRSTTPCTWIRVAKVSNGSGKSDRCVSDITPEDE